MCIITSNLSFSLMLTKHLIITILFISVLSLLSLLSLLILFVFGQEQLTAGNASFASVNNFEFV